MKEEALKLAERLEIMNRNMPLPEAIEASAMIRRLVEELDKAQYVIEPKQIKPTITKLDGKVVAVTMTDDEHRVHEVLWEAPKPLSDEEIKEIYEKCWEGILTIDEINNSEVRFARAIEERHGIK